MHVSYSMNSSSTKPQNNLEKALMAAPLACELSPIPVTFYVLAFGMPNSYREYAHKAKIPCNLWNAWRKHRIPWHKCRFFRLAEPLNWAQMASKIWHISGALYSRLVNFMYYPSALSMCLISFLGSTPANVRNSIDVIPEAHPGQPYKCPAFETAQWETFGTLGGSRLTR